jgi:hypothetical protein
LTILMNNYKTITVWTTTTTGSIPTTHTT